MRFLSLAAVAALAAAPAFAQQTAPDAATPPAAPTFQTDGPPTIADATGATGGVQVVDAGTSGALTLDDAIALGLAQNELIPESEEGVRRAKARIKEIEAQAYPQIRAGGSYTFQKKSSSLLPFGPTDPLTGKATLVSVVFTPASSRSANASLSQLVDIFGLVKRARTIADLTTRVQELNVARSRSEVVYDVRTAYYNVLRAAGGVTVAQAAVTDAEEQLRLAQAFVKAGTSAQFDVTRAQVNVAGLRQTLITTQDALGLAGAALNNALGRDVDAPVVLAGITATPDRTVDIAGQTAKALESRPEVVQSNLGIRAQKENVGVQKLGRYPTFAVTGNYSYNFTASGLSPQNANYNIGLTASVPLYEGGAISARVREAESDVRNAQLQSKQLRRGVALEVRQAGLRVQETADRFAVADQAVASAQEFLRLARVRYSSGVSTQSEVLDAETQLATASNNRNAALYDNLTARADFDASLLGRVTTAGATATSTSSQQSAVASGGSNSSGDVSSSAAGASSQSGQSVGGTTTGGTGSGF